jgi:MFS family permease
VCIVFGLSETETHGGVGSPVAFAPMLAGLALTAFFVVHGLRVARSLIDVRLFRSRAFTGAAATTFLLGAALYGAMLILPLYYQVDRGESAVSAGLLMAPQGLGAMLALPLSGRLTDRIGGGPVVLAGCIIATLATLPWVFVSSSTPYGILAGLLVLRGIGMGSTIQPAMASAYALLRTEQVPGATAALNTLRQVGGSIGTALVAVVLAGQAKAVLPASGGTGSDLLAPLPAGVRAKVAEPVATAFGQTFAVAAGMTGLAVLSAVVLLRAERRTARQDAAPTPDELPPGGATARYRYERRQKSGRWADDGRAIGRQHAGMQNIAGFPPGRLAIGVAALLASVVGLVACGSAWQTDSGVAETLQGKYVSVVNDVSPSVVLIQTPDGLGSGVVLDSNGNVVTNAHVVAGATQLAVTLLRGRQVPATVVGTDPSRDLAVVHMNGRDARPGHVRGLFEDRRRRHRPGHRQSARPALERHRGHRLVAGPQRIRGQRRDAHLGDPDQRGDQPGELGRRARRSQR